MHNIEKSAFRRWQYVGYGGGFRFCIRKDGVGNWEAKPVTQGRYFDVDLKWPVAMRWPRARTLRELSVKLEGLCSP